MADAKLLLKTSALGVLAALFLFLNLIKTIVRPIYRLWAGARLPLVVRTPDERFQGIHKLGYTFTSNYISLDAGAGVKLPRVHYLDEGPETGPVILCLHGEPTWSFLYRHMVPGLVEAGYRVIVPDFIGFGMSDKYTAQENYTHELHTSVLRKLMDHLRLDGITLVCQDWGGLTGLSVVKDCPHKFSNLVIMNTGIPTGAFAADPTGEKRGAGATVVQFLPFVVWRSFVLLFGSSLPVSFTNWLFFTRLYSCDPAVAAAYSAPFPSSVYKAGAARWPLLVPMYTDDPVIPHMQAAQKCLQSWSKPALVMFGDSDPITRGQEKIFLKLIPHARNVTVEGAGHFLQETHGKLLVKNIVGFLGNNID